MGAKAWFVAYHNGNPKETLAQNPTLDREASLKIAKIFSSNASFVELDDGDLADLQPPTNEICVGVYDGLTIVAQEGLMLDAPSKLNPRWYLNGSARYTYLHLTHSVVDWFAYGLWKDGELQRSLSVAPDSGIMEDVGMRPRFEDPFWAGDHAVEDDDEEFSYLLPFHPLEMAEASLLEYLGFQLEGFPTAWVCEPESIPIMHFKVQKTAWWKFW